MARPGSRGRRWAIVSATLGSILLVASVVIFRNRILEEWWILRLAARDPEDRKFAAVKLADAGRERGARALLAVLRARSGPGDAAVDSLGKLFGRVSPRVQAEIVRGLLAAARSLEEWKSPEEFNPNLTEVLEGLQPRADEVFAALTDELSQGETANSIRAMDLLVKAWPHSRAYLSRYFTEAPLEKVLKFYRSLRWLVLNGSFPPEDSGEDLSRSFALDHPKPEIRAVSLAFHVLCSSGRNPALGTQTLRQTYSKDTHPLVRTAAIRIAGWIGDAPGNLDLNTLLFQIEDPRLLEEIIRARVYWTDPFARGRGLEVCEGAVLCWSPEEKEARGWSRWRSSA